MLSEMLLAIAIISVVAVIILPTLIGETMQQNEFRTGLKKAVSSLNSAISAGMSKESMGPYDLNAGYTLYDYLTNHMSVLKKAENISDIYYVKTTDGKIITNKAFYTPDGMRYEFYAPDIKGHHRTYEKGVLFNTCYDGGDCENISNKYACGSFGTNNNYYHTESPPCLITVDVNGDKKPNPGNIKCKSESCASVYRYADTSARRLSDIFSIMITDREAIPFGILAQKTMYSVKK